VILNATKVKAQPRRRKWGVVKGASSPKRSWVYRIVAIVVIIAGSAIYLVSTIHQPDILPTILRGSFATPASLEEWVVLATPFFLTALAVLIPLRVGLWNIGGEGQFFAGAWLATGLAFSFTHLAGGLLIPGMIVAGALGGGLWAVIPALARVYLNVNEIISTLMLNLVMVFWVAFWLVGSWHYQSSTGGTLQSRIIPAQSQLPLLHVAGGLDSGLIIALGITALVGLYLHYSTFGYQSLLVGSGRAVALYTGVRIRRVQMIAMLSAGALAGIAGVLQLTGNSYQLTPGLSNNTGYLGIAVAILAGNSIWGLVVMAGLLSMIMLVGQNVQLYGVSSDAPFIVIGILLLLNAVGDALSQYRVMRHECGDVGAEPDGDDFLEAEGHSLAGSGAIDIEAVNTVAEAD
jgi:simple sugar transport system permease protein